MDYFEVYGIGIVIGDVVEVIFIVDIYIKRNGNLKWKLWVGLVKLNLNYIELIFGFVGLIKVVLMIKNKRLVLIVNVYVLNLKFKLEDKGFVV